MVYLPQKADLPIVYSRKKILLIISLVLPAAPARASARPGCSRNILSSRSRVTCQGKLRMRRLQTKFRVSSANSPAVTRSRLFCQDCLFWGPFVCSRAGNSVCKPNVRVLHSNWLFAYRRIQEEWWGC
ncbi:hypothetical protein RRG08_000510 [Elysia crispata]|uniref:Uncharacterized protein n=1 Tax=Elysia crispata TaxID=231223 RepID=A0AAE0YC76_9GAST|nr:hypothetical protein RRG08_000510 [Elysia crispata]